MTIVCDRPSVSPAVSRITAALRERIAAHVYPRGDWLPTERALAEEFSVSRILIRAAIKELEREGLVSCEAHRRPRVVDRTPRHLAHHAHTSSRSIALFISTSPSWPGTAMIIRGIQEAGGHDHRLVLGTPVGSTRVAQCESEAAFLRRVLRDRDVDGVILDYIGGERNRATLEQVRAAGTPLVFLDHRPPAGFEADYVGVNNRRGEERIVGHVIACGHRSIGYVSNFDDISTVKERLEGYRRGLEGAGVGYREELVERDPGPPGGDAEKGCEPLVERLLRLREPPTAICAVSDTVAYRVMAALKSRGVRVPEDISIAGFDGVERWAPSPQFLTTVDQPFDCLGTEAVELVMERSRGGLAGPSRHVILDVQLAVHDSVRCVNGAAAR